MNTPVFPFNCEGTLLITGGLPHLEGDRVPLVRQGPCLVGHRLTSNNTRKYLVLNQPN